ncbi:TadE/TadG family type IV pilus assembly protein [Vibrio astriarenae]|uniref:TadE/TadG family type IV pilus assembly protein n=1 Tax=Vibrio astriarenae TaxID=1481923 RepID=UPI001EF966C9|nr:TadE family protein [Vibrio astriarenae]
MEKQNLRQQKGLAAVEFIVTIPVLLLIVVGMVEVGNALVKYNTLNKMVQSGVRYATSDIQGTSSYDQIADTTAIKNMVVYGESSSGGSSLLEGVGVDDVTVTHSSGYVTITLASSYTPVLLGLPDSSLYSVPLNASAVMRTAP